MDLPKIGISIGDINGIGPEIIIKTLSEAYWHNRFTPIIYGSSRVMAYFKNIFSDRNFSFVNIDHASEALVNKINVITCWHENLKIELGEITEDSGKAAYAALDKAVSDLNDKMINALVTSPINKKAMNLAGFGYPGHTEFIAEKIGQAGRELMMMVSDNLKIATLTTHLPVTEAIKSITIDAISTGVRVMNESLKLDFGIERPLIAILGVNPHAGDNGVIGQEEIQIVTPAIESLKNEGILVSGPYGADGFFGSGQYHKFDGVMAMYHDQGLIPFKALTFGVGVNYTAGLHVIRTSPDHGTGHDIAGKNLAEPDSLRQAIYLALDIYRNRQIYLEASSNKVHSNRLHSELNR